MLDDQEEVGQARAKAQVVRSVSTPTDANSAQDCARVPASLVRSTSAPVREQTAATSPEQAHSSNASSIYGVQGFCMFFGC